MTFLCLLLFVACLSSQILLFVNVYVTFALGEYRALNAMITVPHSDRFTFHLTGL